MSGPERKVPGEPVRMDAEDPHIGAHHRGSKHPLAIPEGVSTIGHAGIRKRAKRQSRPRDETLVISCMTGGSAWVTLGQATPILSDNNCIPVMPWHASSFFWDWTPVAIPYKWTPANLAGGFYDRPTLANFALNLPLIPRHEAYDHADEPAWFSTSFKGGTSVVAGRSETALSTWAPEVEAARRLPVNGQYHEETLKFQGKIVIPPFVLRAGEPAFETPDYATIGKGRPWVRLLAIQFDDEDMSDTLLHQVLLTQFYAQLSTDTVVAYEDPDYARRRTEAQKTVESYKQKYRVLIDHTWDVGRKPDGSWVREIPLKLNLGPRTIRMWDGTLDQDTADPPYHYPREYGASKKGRIVWQLFHNLAPYLQPAALSKYSQYMTPVWYGTWTLQIKDGNF